MAMIPDAGGAKKSKLGLWAPGLKNYTGQVKDDEEEQALYRLQTAAQTAEAQQFAGVVSPSEYLKKPDDSSQAMSTINRVGGPKEYSRRLSKIALYWLTRWGTNIAPAFALDLARVPVNDKDMQRAFSNSKHGSGIYRGLVDPDNMKLTQEYAGAGVVYSGEDNLRPVDKKKLDLSRSTFGAPEKIGQEATAAPDLLWWTERFRSSVEKDLRRPYEKIGRAHV